MGLNETCNEVRTSKYLSEDFPLIQRNLKPGDA
jgi:hypothetical protein